VEIGVESGDRGHAGQPIASKGDSFWVGVEQMSFQLKNSHNHTGPVDTNAAEDLARAHVIGLRE
jgi:hypothetical protein